MRSDNIAIVQQEVAPGVYKGKWGNYNCNYETYLMLRKIKKYYFKAQHQVGTWKRWYRKAPSNRVIREKIRDAKGLLIGYKVIGPRAEPTVNPVLVSKDINKQRIWHNSAPQEVEVEVLSLHDEIDFQHALSHCGPYATPGQVVQPAEGYWSRVRDLAYRIDRYEASKS